MPPKRATINFPIAKKNKQVTTKGTTTKRKQATRKSDQENDDIVEPKLPKSCNKADNSSSIEEEMQEILDVLGNSAAGQMCEREQQMETIRSYLNRCLDCNENISLYVWGSGGTGKTVTLEYLQSQTDIQKNFIVAHINCFYCGNGTNVYAEIIAKVGGDVKGVKTQKDYVDRMFKTMNGLKKPVLLILDGIDTLKMRNQTILYSLFELPSKLREGQIALIAVGNLLNFVDRNLPRLKSAFSRKPDTLEFPIYKESNIINIISKRLTKVNLKRIVIEPHALLLLTKKAAVAVCGDARDALQLTKEVIETCVANDTKDGVCTITPMSVQLVMTDILDDVHKLTSLDNLPLQQKLIVCSLLLIIKEKKFDRTKLNIFIIEDTYRKICKQRNIEACHSDEFINLCSLIECYGIFSIMGKVKSRSSKISLNWNEDDIERHFADKTLFGNILNVRAS